MKNNTKIPSLTIVIPAYNEEKRIQATLKELNRTILPVKTKPKIIVVDDGSKDRTGKIAKKFGAEVITFKKNKGKGAAVKAGVLASRTEWTLFMDADMSTPMSMLERFITHLDSDMIIASRNLPESELPLKQPTFRRLLGKGFPLIVRMIALRRIKDTQCGFKLMRTKQAKEIFEKMTIDRFGFDVEVIYIAKKMKLKIKEIPVVWKNDPRSKVHPIKDAARMFRDVIQIRINDLRKKY
jgi:dolichyl-phosphate beta-glucosyltransferase